LVSLGAALAGPSGRLQGPAGSMECARRRAVNPGQERGVRLISRKEHRAMSELRPGPASFSAPWTCFARAAMKSQSLTRTVAPPLPAAPNRAPWLSKPARGYRPHRSFRSPRRSHRQVNRNYRAGDRFTTAPKIRKWGEGRKGVFFLQSSRERPYNSPLDLSRPP
jgi:hypothetical protein